MLILLALPVLVTVAAVHRYLQCYAPTNLLARRVRAREPHWRTAVALSALAAALLVAMHILIGIIANGAPGWLNLVVLVLAWDAIKCGVIALATALRTLCAVHTRWAWDRALTPNVSSYDGTWSADVQR